MKIYLVEVLGLCVALVVFGFLVFSNMPQEHFDESQIETAPLSVRASPR